MKRETKLTPREQSLQQAAAQSEQTTREFGSADELLRFDAGQTEVPPAIAEKLRQSAAGLPSPSRPWWQRLFKS